MEVGRGAVEDAGGFAGAVEEKEGGDGGDVAEGLGGGGVGDGPVQVGAEGACGGADLVFGRFDGEGEDGEVVAVFALEFAEPLESGAAGWAPGGPELDEDDAAGKLVGGERLTKKISQFELRESGDFLGDGGGCGLFAGDNIFFAGEDQVNHSNEIGLEFLLAGCATPGSVAAGAFDFSEVAEFARSGDEDVVDEDGGIAFDAKFFGELGGAKVFGDEADLARVSGGYFLDQQTCWVGDISSVRPADEGDVHGLTGGLLERRGRLQRGEIGGEHLIEDDTSACPFIGTRGGAIGVCDLRLGALEEELGQGIVLLGGCEFVARGSEISFQC